MKVVGFRRKNQDRSRGEKCVVRFACCSLFVSLFLFSFFFVSCASVRKPVLEKEGIKSEQKFNLIPTSDEKIYAQRIASKIEESAEISSNEFLNGYLEEMGLRIIDRTHFRHLIRDRMWSFKIIDSSDAIAFAALGGQIYLTRGMIEATESVSELAGILSFEIGHLMGYHVHEHIYEKLRSQAGFPLGKTLTGESGWEVLSRIFEGEGGVFSFFENLRYNPSQVEKSDEFALSNCYDAGFNPEGFNTLVNRLGKRENPPHPWMEKNPWSRKRSEKISSFLKLLPSFPFSEEQSRFNRFKAELKSLATPPLQERPKVYIESNQVSSNDISVFGHLDWTDTGMSVKENQEIHFKASGEISLQKGNPMAKCGPEGYNLKTLQQPLPDHKIGALIGQVVQLVSIEADEETGEKIRNEVIKKFYIGLENSVRMPLTGRLFLGINENVVGDNEGEFKVTLYLNKDHKENK